jgi:DNA polymerase III epsilon subunit-like protein
MSKKQYFVIVDTETTIEQTVADFGAVVMDRNGRIVDQIAVLVSDHFDRFDLWFDPSVNASAFWSEQNARARRKKYESMLNSGMRSIASAGYINSWLARVRGEFQPRGLTAYNISFDRSKCYNTSIDLGGFTQFCLLLASRRYLKRCSAHVYPKWAINNGYVTKTGRESYSADAVSHWFYRNLPVEPHTAVEDARDFEAPILKALLKRYGWWGIQNLVDADPSGDENLPN